MPYLGMLGMNDWCSIFWQHYKTIRCGILCIHKASGDRICQNWQHLEVAKNVMFPVLKFSHLENFEAANS